MLTNVPKDNTTAVLMLCATIPRDRTTVHVNLDILEMDGLAKVQVANIMGERENFIHKVDVTD